jgi:hypothetical protein
LAVFVFLEIEYQMKKTNAYIIKMHEDVIKLIDSGKLENAKKIINSNLSEKGFNKTSETQIKFNFASLYIDIADYYSKDARYLDEADLILKKTSDVFKKIKNTIPKEFELNLKLNTARIFLIKYDVQYAKNQLINNNNQLTYSKLNSIYDIENYLLDSIRFYRDCFKEILDNQELYSIRNNIANCLIRVGWYIEAIELLNENINTNPERWQSHASYGDALFNFRETGLLPLTTSYFLKVIDAQNNALALNPYKIAERDILNNRAICVRELKEYGVVFKDEFIEINNKEELDEFSTLNQLRQFVLKNNLALNEQSTDFNMSLITVDGKILISNNYTSTSSINNVIDMKNYSNGVYFLQIKSETEQATYQIVKQ